MLERHLSVGQQHSLVDLWRHSLTGHATFVKFCFPKHSKIGRGYMIQRQIFNSDCARVVCVWGNKPSISCWKHRSWKMAQTSYRCFCYTWRKINRWGQLVNSLRRDAKWTSNTMEAVCRPFHAEESGWQGQGPNRKAAPVKDTVSPMQLSRNQKRYMVMFRRLRRRPSLELIKSWH